MRAVEQKTYFSTKFKAYLPYFSDSRVINATDTATTVDIAANEEMVITSIYVVCGGTATDVVIEDGAGNEKYRITLAANADKFLNNLEIPIGTQLRVYCSVGGATATVNLNYRMTINPERI